MAEDTTLRDGAGEILTIADRALVMRYIKHELPDGDYAVQGPGIFRISGVVYPAAGIVDDGRMPSRTREECVRHFGRGDPHF